MRTERCRPQIETAKTCISAYALYSIRCGEKFGKVRTCQILQRNDILSYRAITKGALDGIGKEK